MSNDKQVAKYLEQELGQSSLWCLKVIDDFKRFAFRTSRVLDVPPLTIMLGIARSVLDQERRSNGPDLEEELERSVAIRRRKRPTLPPERYTPEDAAFLDSV